MKTRYGDGDLGEAERYNCVNSHEVRVLKLLSNFGRFLLLLFTPQTERLPNLRAN